MFFENEKRAWRDSKSVVERTDGATREEPVLKMMNVHILHRLLTIIILGHSPWPLLLPGVTLTVLLRFFHQWHWGYASSWVPEVCSDELVVVNGWLHRWWSALLGELEPCVLGFRLFACEGCGL